ncbi:MAG TPA: DPP IV N-terminal domain-containing protein [Blastocatellia bacterium]|nr:DPP IV N-terminal domain-containing protein [Blastocatellia bacterium]HMZ16965.1 DPP IV N-terminal domain-containing protein [Blastocatellia bacterium]
MTVLMTTICIAQPRALTAEDYVRAEKLMGYNTAPLVLRAGVRPTWLPDGRFWYRVATENGNEFVLVDPARGVKGPAFDHAKLAAALSAATGAKYEAFKLPFQQIEFSADGKTISFNVERRRFTCDVQGNQCRAEAGENREAGQRNGQRGARGFGADAMATSPDGKRVAFIRDYNLWVREAATGKETQLTTDGVKDFGYATNNAGWSKSDSPVLAWSPDSKKIATFQHDGRGVGEMYLVNTQVGHPKLEAWKYPLPGDAKIFLIERVIIDVDAAKVVRLKMPADPHRSTLCDHVVCGGVWADVQWSEDGKQVAFVSSSRDHKEATLRVADAATGAVRDVLEEKVATFFESGNGRVNWRYLAASNEVLWFSERDNWGQLYLYDAQTGKLKNQITAGEGNVTQLLRVDERNRQLYFLGVGKEKGRDPYFRHFYRVGFDGKGLKLLSPEDADHDISLSPSGQFFVDGYSKPDVPPVAVLRDWDGKQILVLEKADISRLLATGWKPPQPVTVKARDGVTDLYGLMFVPTKLDPNKKYPIINNIYPGPQTGSVRGRNFSAERGDQQALAELGFVVIQVDGMGTPWRSKKFHEFWYGEMGDNTLPDQVTAMKQLAQRHAWIDIDRAGMYGHSGGGNATAAAMFQYPDFFKVGVAQAGNHDNREYEDDWAEKWQGLLKRNEDGTTNYDNQANQLIAKNLKGKLLLAHGTLDNNVPPYSTLLVVNELIKANKDFDLILFPNRAHGFGNEPYMVRRRWDYFVKHLLGAEPPKEFELRPPM